MQTLPLRLTPGQDLREAIEAVVLSHNCRAAFVLCGIGSLSTAGLRFAGADQPQRLMGDTEILSLSGTVAVNVTDSGGHSSSHLHMAPVSRMRQRGMTSWWCGRLMSQIAISNLAMTYASS